MDGKKIVIGVLGATFLLLAFLVWTGLNGGSTHVPGEPNPMAQPSDGGGTSTKIASDAPAAQCLVDAGVVTSTLHDKAMRDEVRRRILEAWASPDEAKAVAVASDDALSKMPMPERDGGVDPSYIQGVFRSEFAPLVIKCFEHLRGRGDASDDTKLDVEVSFTIVGDEKIGGIVESAEVSSDGGLADEEFTTCVRESMLSVAFRPPPHGGKVTVRYPFSMGQ